MEHIEYVAQFEKMIDNKIIGRPELIDTKITFRGKNNILVCDNNIKLEKAVLEFNGNNSIVYLGSDLNNDFRLLIYNNSAVYIGKNVKMGFSLKVTALESQNVIIGDDCILNDGVYVSNSDGYSFYNIDSKEKFNFSRSILIGDHVFLGDNVYISKGVNIGSGSIIDNLSFVPSYAKIPSNVYLYGNPANIIKKDVFFTNDYAGPYKNEDILNSKDYKSNVFIFEKINNETLSFDSIDKILNDLDVESKWDFIQKLFIRNKRKNRFSL